MLGTIDHFFLGATATLGSAFFFLFIAILSFLRCLLLVLFDTGGSSRNFFFLLFRLLVRLGSVLSDWLRLRLFLAEHLLGDVLQLFGIVLRSCLFPVLKVRLLVTSFSFLLLLCFLFGSALPLLFLALVTFLEVGSLLLLLDLEAFGFLSLDSLLSGGLLGCLLSVLSSDLLFDAADFLVVDLALSLSLDFLTRLLRLPFVLLKALVLIISLVPLELLIDELLIEVALMADPGNITLVKYDSFEVLARILQLILVYFHLFVRGVQLDDLIDLPFTVVIVRTSLLVICTAVLRVATTTSSTVRVSSVVTTVGEPTTTGRGRTLVVHAIRGNLAFPGLFVLRRGVEVIALFVASASSTLVVIIAVPASIIVVGALAAAIKIGVVIVAAVVASTATSSVAFCGA